MKRVRNCSRTSMLLDQLSDMVILNIKRVFVNLLVNNDDILEMYNLNYDKSLLIK